MRATENALQTCEARALDLLLAQYHSNAWLANRRASWCTDSIDARLLSGSHVDSTVATGATFTIGSVFDSGELIIGLTLLSVTVL